MRFTSSSPFKKRLGGVLGLLLGAVEGARRTPSTTLKRSKARKLARVEESIRPRQDGLVFFESTYWNAQFYDPRCSITVFPGEWVQVIDRDSLTLLVMPIDVEEISPMANEAEAIGSTRQPLGPQWMPVFRR